MADDSKGPKDDAAKAQVLMSQLSGVLNNPVMRSLMGSGSFGTKGDLATKGKAAGGPGQGGPQKPLGPGMAPMKPLPPIKPLPGMTGPKVVGGAQAVEGMNAAAALVSQIPREQLAPMLDQLQTIVVQLDGMMKSLGQLKGGNPVLKKQIRAAVGQIVAHLPMLITQIQLQLVAHNSPEAKALPALIDQIQKQLLKVDEGLDDEKQKSSPPAPVKK
jgi:hypothetical protein